MAVDVSDPTELHGAAVTGDRGAELGRVENVYLDNASGRVEWAAVRSGTRDGHLALVPLAAAGYRDGILHLPYTADQVRDAPHHDPGQELSTDAERALLTHYGVAERRDRSGTAGAVGPGAPGSTTDGAMTRSEEELRVGTETVPVGRARLRRRVVTEMATITVPVSHEEVFLDREEIADADRGAATSGPVDSTGDQEVTLYEVTLRAEQPVVTIETVDKERVRLGVRTVTEQQQVSGQVRKEQIETDVADERR